MTEMGTNGRTHDAMYRRSNFSVAPRSQSSRLQEVVLPIVRQVRSFDAITTGRLGMHRMAALLLACVAGMTCAGCAEQNPQNAWTGRDCPAWTYDHGGIVRGDRATGSIALVFTGGDYGEGTEAVLGALLAAHVRASFFLTGGYLAAPEHRRFVERMVADGHYVGPHSHAHPLYCSWEDRDRSLISRDEFAADLETNIEELRSLGALQPGSPVLFIPPYEWYNDDQVEWARGIGVVLINFTPGTGSNRDWIPEGHEGFVSSERIADDILAYERSEADGLNGFLLLLHIGSTRIDKMHPQVAGLIDALKKRGYRFERVDALLKPGRVTE